MKTVTINYKGIELKVKGIYTPREDEITYDSDMGGSPAHASNFDVESIRVLDSDVDIFDLLEGELEYIEQLCIDSIED